MLSLSVERLCDYFCIILIFWYASPVGSCPWVISDAQNAIWWCHSSIASLMMLCPKPSHTSMRCCFRSNRSWTFVLRTHCCISLISYSQPGSDPDCWVATGSGAVNTDISCSRSLIVMRVLCAEALFCCKTRKSPEISCATRSSCWVRSICAIDLHSRINEYQLRSPQLWHTNENHQKITEFERLSFAR